MRVYVAGSTREVERVREIQRIVKNHGHTITFDWTGPEGEIRNDGDWDRFPERGAEIAATEIAACRSAGLNVVLCPESGLGCWIEVGATLALGGLVWLIEPKRDSVFWQHPNVSRFPSAPDFERALAERAWEGEKAR